MTTHFIPPTKAIILQVSRAVSPCFEDMTERHIITECHTIAKACYTESTNNESTWHMAITTQRKHCWNLKHFPAFPYLKRNKTSQQQYCSKNSCGNLLPSPRSGLKALLTQSAKTITVQPCLSRPILPGRHIKAAILNHVSRRTSNDYWASAYFNINSLEAGIVGSEGGWNQRQQGESSVHSD